MIQSTVDRLGNLVPPERVLIVTNRQLVEPIAAQLPQLPPQAILGEPCKRDTAPCIGLAALVVSRHDADATMAVMPSDHVIRSDQQFQAALRFAAKLVETRPERIVTFGIRPTYPAESFGYIQRGQPLAELRDSTSGSEAPKAYEVSRFREKPRVEAARQYLDSGDYYWNAGIFVWKAATILAALRQRQPAMMEHLERIAAALQTPSFDDVFSREFELIRGISVDYAVMEHAREVAVVEAPFEWDDVGSWQALARLRGTDDQGNTIAASRHLGINTSGTIVRSSGDHLIATLGLKDCLVIHTPDATLVANKHDEEAIRQLVKLIEENGWQEYLLRLALSTTYDIGDACALMLCENLCQSGLEWLEQAKHRVSKRQGGTEGVEAMRIELPHDL
jgi:mannose-1-phosphate guanylyltransferase